MFLKQRGKRLAATGSGAWLWLGLALCWTLGAVAEEVLLDGPVVSTQFHPAVAAFPSGDVVVVWADTRGSENLEIRARRYDETGQPVDGSSFVVNTFTASTQTYPTVATTDSGGFVVVWESLSGDQNAGIKGRVYDSLAQPVGPEFAVQVDTSVQERRPAISRAPDGSFVVAWTVQGESLRGRRLDAVGQPVGDEWLLDGNNAFRGVALAHNADGEFLVTWRRSGAPASGRLFDADGLPLGPEITFSTPPITNAAPAVAFNDGRFLVTPIASDLSMRGQFYDSSGAQLGAEFAVADDVNPLFGTAIDSAPMGEFQVVWNEPDTGGAGIFSRRFSSTGAPVGQTRRLNSTVPGDQQRPDVAVDMTGRPIVVWRGPQDFPSGGAVFGCFELPGEDIFLDGFESGDTSAWSAEVP
ncbi:MAG: hypothetical protein AAFY88_17845 [Acidobacteriota bacterium]